MLTNLTQTTFDNIPASASLSQLVQVVTSWNAPFGGHALQVFPNPFTGKIRVQSSLGNEVTVQVVDVFGRELHTSRFQSTAELSLSYLPDGVFYPRFPQLHQCHKVVKTR